MKRRILALLLATLMIVGLAACGDAGGATPTPSEDATPTPEGERLSAATVKVGVVLIGEENDNGYNYNHMVGIEEMAAELGLSDEQIIVKRNVPEDSACETAVRELAEAGCNIIFCNSFGHEQYMLAVAEDYPDVQFCHATGSQAAGSGLDNVHNYFTKIFEARYLAGIAAGLKAKEIGNPKLGYVGAFPFAEVISGFTAFYLGAQSVYPEVTMEVMYTGSWSDATKEAQVAQALIDNGAGVISQHSDTTAPATTAEANGVFQVGYNADMIAAAPAASLVSARVDWGVYYIFAVNSLIEGTEIPVDWCQGFAEGAVFLSPLNEDIVAEGTAEAIAAAEEQLRNGFHVFSGPLTGEGKDWDGNPVTLELAEGEFFDESGSQSAPSFMYIISGITSNEGG